jgi:hypothetical protein
MASKIQPTFEVDKKGMAMVFARKGKGFVVSELVQNAWDEDTSRVDVTLAPEGSGKYRLTVEDDNPEGFADLAHAYTLFAESAKKSDPTKRGRFNLGEKLVIAICEESKIATTKGTVTFTSKGRQHGTAKRPSGSVFTGLLKLTKAEAAEVADALFALIPPEGITTTFNGTELPDRTPLRSFDVSLRTEVSDEDGRLKATTRKTTVEVYEPLTGETPAIYEMGIPVVETGDRFHVNIGQKIPLNTDRDNVPPGFLRDVRVEVLNRTHDLLSADDHKQAWVTNAMEDEKASPEAVKSAFVGKFGEKTVIFDPNDPEANKLAMEQGYNVIPGGSLPKAAWSNVKTGGVSLPAGQVTPSPNPSAGADEIKVMDPDHYPESVAEVVDYAKRLARAIMDVDIDVQIGQAVTWPYLATYGSRRLTLNLGRLGYKWFEARTPEGRAKITDLLIHEFGHEYCSDHLDHKYLHALTRLGGKAVEAALEDPALFDISSPVPA